MNDINLDSKAMAPLQTSDGPKITIIKSSTPKDSGLTKPMSATCKVKPKQQQTVATKQVFGNSTTPNKDVTKTPEKIKPGAV